MLSFEDGSCPHTEEHLFWVRKEGKQWFWTSNLDICLYEAKIGVVEGLFDQSSIFTGGDPEFANIYDVWSREELVDITEKYDHETVVYQPMPVDDSDRMAIVDGYVVTSGTNQWKHDYSKFRWDEAKAARIRETLKTNAAAAKA
jgi:hypothetical protein